MNMNIVNWFKTTQEISDNMLIFVVSKHEFASKYVFDLVRLINGKFSKDGCVCSLDPVPTKWLKWFIFIVWSAVSSLTQMYSPIYG